MRPKYSSIADTGDSALLHRCHTCWYNCVKECIEWSISCSTIYVLEISCYHVENIMTWHGYPRSLHYNIVASAQWCLWWYACCHSIFWFLFVMIAVAIGLLLRVVLSLDMERRLLINAKEKMSYFHDAVLYSYYSFSSYIIFTSHFYSKNDFLVL